MRNDEGGDVDFLREGVRVLAQALMEVAYISTVWGVTRIPAHRPWSSEAFPATRHHTATGYASYIAGAVGGRIRSCAGLSRSVARPSTR